MTSLIRARQRRARSPWREVSRGRPQRGGSFELFVNGTLMHGLALHRNLEGAEFLGEVRTAPIYRLYSIGDLHPGMFEVSQGGVAVDREVYRVTDQIWPREAAARRHRDISAFGSWRAYIAAAGSTRRGGT